MKLKVTAYIYIYIYIYIITPFAYCKCMQSAVVEGNAFLELRARLFCSAQRVVGPSPLTPHCSRRYFLMNEESPSRITQIHDCRQESARSVQCFSRTMRRFRSSSIVTGSSSLFCCTHSSLTIKKKNIFVFNLP